MGGERERSNSNSNSSSEEDDGDAEWRRAINSVAAVTSSYITNASAAEPKQQPPPIPQPHHPPKPKHYQLKIQKLLDEMLEKSLVMVKYDDINDNENDINVSHSDPLTNNGGEIRLFKHSTPGILLDHIDEPQQPRKRPKILPGEEINEKSKKFKRRLQSVSIDGESIMASAKIAGQKSLARLEAKDLATKETAKKEEERVSELKRVRGEKWLPSIARNRF